MKGAQPRSARWIAFTGILTVLMSIHAMPAAAQQPSRHPLDPLSAEEYQRAVQVLRSAGHLDDASRFATLELRDPDKAGVLAWRPGAAFDRSAFAVIKQGPETYEAVIDLTGGTVRSWQRIGGVQPSILTEELMAVADILGAHDAFVAALRTRGYSMDQVFCAPFSLGNYDIPRHEGRRLVKASCFVMGEVSPFHRPIEGLWAVVDLNAREIVDVVDQAVIPVSDAPAALDGASVATARASLHPVVMHQPNGLNFTLRGHVLEWDNWSLHYRMEKRSGLVVSMVHFRDGDRQRRILYQGALSEIFVPYMDPDGNWFSRTFMDAGEYGFGANATSLEAGIDCPETAVMLDATVADETGAPAVMTDVICIFERSTGDPAWRHYDNIFATGFAGRRAVELVLRMIATIGNYDYYQDWVFTQDGRIRSRIGATGFDGLKGVRSRSMRDATAGAETTYGTLVAPGLVATNHDHFFSIRLDVDIDGSENSLSIDRLVSKDFEGPRSGWVVEPSIPRTEREAQLEYNPAHPAHWRIINPGANGPLGHAPGYVLKPENSVAHSMLNAGDKAQQRAAFTQHQLWVTPLNPEERYAAGMYVNQSDGGLGLAQWTAANRAITNTDIVLWYTAGFHHVPRTEDFPVMPSAWHEFQLMPFNFFERNPALDVPTAWRSATNGGR